jgi:maltooligosyltrehalose trehalohydrolase
MAVEICGEAVLPMPPAERGYWEAAVADSLSGRDYRFLIDGSTPRADPASRFQPEGVHGPSRVLNPEFPWRDAAWDGPRLEDYVIYELHVGTFTPEGTFASASARLGHLRDLGVTAVELMPVAQFPGSRNWGYDGVYPFAVQNSYGGPRGLQEFVDACHRHSLAVVLDVVYNHLGPEGNYLRDFGPYFTDRHRTPWGAAINFDGPFCDGVRQFFIENALYWIAEFHVDALRLDAVHGIVDPSAYPFLEELADQVHQLGTDLGRNVYLIAESNLNDPRLVSPKNRGGYGLDAQWNDDFHHALRTILTADRSGYYSDFGSLDHVAKAYREGFVYTGEYSVYRNRRHGRPSDDLTGTQIVVFHSNHDQIGNRRLGERLGSLLTFEEQKLAAGAVLLAPFVPLLFMGEEYGETAPFLYFIEHGDAELVEAVRRGRAEEFAAFGWEGEVPDPQSRGSFDASKLQWPLAETEPHRTMLRYYSALIRLRRRISPILFDRAVTKHAVTGDNEDMVEVRCSARGESVRMILNFGKRSIELREMAEAGKWRLLLDSADRDWGGPGGLPGAVQPRSIALYGLLS